MSRDFRPLLKIPVRESTELQCITWHVGMWALGMWACGHVGTCARGHWACGYVDRVRVCGLPLVGLSSRVLPRGVVLPPSSPPSRSGSRQVRSLLVFVFLNLEKIFRTMWSFNTEGDGGWYKSCDWLSAGPYFLHVIDWVLDHPLFLLVWFEIGQCKINLSPY